MAKSSLFAKIQKQFSAHRLARARGISVEDLRGQIAERDSVPDEKRRSLILAAGAFAATALTPKPLRAAPAKGEPRIAIIGAGIAGLTCALELADRGIRATVHEASHRVGGRMFSHRSGYWNDGQISEWGGEFIDTGHKTIRRLARRFDLKLDGVNTAAPAGATDTFFFDGSYYTTSQADADFSIIYDLVQADSAAAPFPTTFDAFTPEAQTLDRMSLYDWIESRAPGGHAHKLGQLLDVAYAIECAADTTDQSALNILYLLGFQPDSSGKTLALFGESDERFHIRGGNELLPRAMAACLGQNANNVLAQAEPVFPGIGRQWNGKATQALWQLHPLTKLSYAYYGVGQYTDFGGYEKVRQGRVYFCGEHTSTDFQGFMEGGAAEGKRAARQIAKLFP